MLRPGFVDEWNKVDSLASGFAKTLLSKQNAKPSACFKLFMSYDPEAILWLGFTSKDKGVQERFNNFLKVWPEAHQRIPYVLMQEMRITPELPIYAELKQKIFLELIDGKLTTAEEMRVFLEPFSPPAPPPQVTIKRSRAKRAGARIKEQAIEEEESEDALPEEDLEIGGDDEELDLSILPKGALADGIEDDSEGEEEEELDGDGTDSVPSKKLKGKKGQKPAAIVKPAAAAKPSAAKPAAAAVPAKPAPAKSAAAPASKKPAAAPAKPIAKPVDKVAAKPAKVAAKAPAKKHAPAKAARPKPKAKPASKPVKKAHKKPAKPAAKKPAPKKSKKR
jgi:hypothetical protein